MLQEAQESFLGSQNLMKKTEFNTSSGISRELDEHPEYAEMLKKQSSVRNEKSENNVLHIIKEKVELPKLFASFKDKSKENVQDQATLYLNILGYGKGGEKSLVDTPKEKSEKEDFWPDSVNFKKFGHPSKALIEANEDLIEIILEYFGYDKLTHCDYPPIQEVKKRGKKPKPKQEGAEENKSKVKVKEAKQGAEITTKTKKRVTFLEESDDEKDESNVKVKKQKKHNPVQQMKKLGPYEQVLEDNIKERKKMEKTLNITNLSKRLDEAEIPDADIMIV